MNHFRYHPELFRGGGNVCRDRPELVWSPCSVFTELSRSVVMVTKPLAPGAATVTSPPVGCSTRDVFPVETPIVTLSACVSWTKGEFLK